MINNKEEQLRILGERGEEIRQGESELKSEKHELSLLERQKNKLKYTIAIETTQKYSNEYLGISNKARDEIWQKIREDFLDEFIREKGNLESLQPFIKDKQVEILIETTKSMETYHLYKDKEKEIERHLNEALKAKKKKEIEEQVEIQGEELDRKIADQKAKLESLEIALNERKEQLQKELEEDLVNESENIEEGEQLERDLHAKRKNLFNELASKEIVNRETERLRKEFEEFESKMVKEAEKVRIEKEKLETELKNLRDQAKTDKAELVNKLEAERKAKNTANDNISQLNSKLKSLENVNSQLTTAQAEITKLKKQLTEKEQAEKDRREGNLSYLSEAKEYGKNIYNWIPSGGGVVIFLILAIPILWMLKYVFRLLNRLKKLLVEIWTEIRSLFSKSIKTRKAEEKLLVESSEPKEQGETPIQEIEKKPVKEVKKKKGRKKKTTKN